jgi:hypothetical protein
MTKTCELCVILGGQDETMASRLRAAIAATTFDEISYAKGAAYRLDGEWYDTADISFHLLGRDHPPIRDDWRALWGTVEVFPKDKDHRHTADYSLWR